MTTDISFFEGTEKRIEIDFSGDGDLRGAKQDDWDEVVRLSATQILNRKVTEQFTSFLLSESSLIVYPRKAILKTCGNTVPVSAVKKLKAIAQEQGLQEEWLCYSRKNFLAPHHQPEVHQSQEAEIALCKQECGEGDGFVLGPMTGEHWLIYDASYQYTDCMIRGDFQVDMMMYDLPKDVQDIFYTNLGEGSKEGAAKMTADSGLKEIFDCISGEVDDYCFDQCGYSCNVHAGDAYAMVHVTPQDECSYASFETNFGSTRVGLPDDKVEAKLNDLVEKVLNAFRPRKLTMTLFIDQGAAPSIGSAPFAAPLKGYKRRNSTSTTFESDYSAMIANFERRDCCSP
eukprot:TRINITY_DN51567_c0_g1_i1.p1 TRINITY_DN51567_c0_g1~~TRINITY_DN51567_c0_g1_i1.p1  ORF type:complete len:343 (-),score=57.48 TRINITY_DN51567_c0_g1_i1:141-1169(-)